MTAWAKAMQVKWGQRPIMTRPSEGERRADGIPISSYYT
jgi:hypothetical protein